MKRKTSQSVAAFVLVAASVLWSSSFSQTTENYSASDLADWDLLGIGDVTVLESEDAIRLTEGADSAGVILLSPRAFPRDITLRFDVRPERHEGVKVVFLSVSPRQGDEMDVPADYNGSFGFWNGPDAQSYNYVIGFHTAFHQPNAFISRNPDAQMLAHAADTANSEEWHTVEISRDGERLELIIDGVTVITAIDTGTGLPGGSVGLRLRGPGDGTFSSLFKNFSVEFAGD